MRYSRTSTKSRSSVWNGALTPSFFASSAESWQCPELVYGSLLGANEGKVCHDSIARDREVTERDDGDPPIQSHCDQVSDELDHAGCQTSDLVGHGSGRVEDEDDVDGASTDRNSVS